MQYLLANGEHLHIREALPEDAPALLDMFRAVVRETDFLMTTPEEAAQITEIREKQFIANYQNNENSLLLVALSEKRIVGNLSLTQSRWQKQKHIGELGVVVLSDYWNMGIARRMINYLMKWIENHPVIRYMQLRVVAENEKAIRLYRNFGFTEEGRSPRAVCSGLGIYSDIILMGKWIGEK